MLIGLDLLPAYAACFVAADTMTAHHGVAPLWRFAVCCRASDAAKKSGQPGTLATIELSFTCRLTAAINPLL
jgi:hypothetical protein